ncbi:biopolymer transporter ExbD [Sphingomonas ginsenosidivorax]|uniref:biopolymer transporter ExbD n=1 Tax=Sphingomonas ginsenosidivorax TaxID=862135 RepID=UPI001F54BF68|nr:biopolymer transporter ExbD [Sphingomonas ginsenosidivorax]
MRTRRVFAAIHWDQTANVRDWWEADVPERTKFRHQVYMKLNVRHVALVSLLVSTSAHSSQRTLPPFRVMVRGPASSCSIEVDGRKVTTDELLAIARPEAKSGRRAHLDTDMGQTPYRCIGRAIYTLQRAGFTKVAFISKPPTSSED